MDIIKSLIHKKDKSLDISAPHSYTLYGVNIHKLTIAKYVEFLKVADDLPEIIFNNAFPDCDNVADLIDSIARLDKQAILQLVGRLLKTVPTEFCKLVANLLDFDENRLLDVNNENALTLNELLEIIIAFVEINDYSDFFMNVQQLRKTFRKMSDSTQEHTGSNAG